MKKFTIYLRRNKINGKCYVGQTGNFRERENHWHCLKAIYANNHINEDREKYGLDNWTVEILGEADTREEAWELEQRFIRDFNTIWPNGYNLDSSGNKVKHHNETIKKISENNVKYWLGKHHSEETKQKISDAAQKKQVYQYTLDGELIAIYSSRNEAAKKTGFNKNHIGNCCNGNRKKHKGYRWSYNPL